MKKIFAFLIMFFSINSYSVTDIYVSSSGNDSNPGTSSQPVLTLDGAQNIIISNGDAGSETYNVYIIGPNEVKMKDDTGTDLNCYGGTQYPVENDVLEWTQSGSASHPINFIGLPKFSKLKGKLVIRQSNYISMSNIEFNRKLASIIQIEHSNNINIYLNKFFSDADHPCWGGSGSIWVGNSNSNNYDDDPSDIYSAFKPSFNTSSWTYWKSKLLADDDDFMSHTIYIHNNYFNYSGTQTAPTSAYWQGIYLSQGSKNVSVRYNTIVNPPGTGVAVYHDFTAYHDISFNYIYMKNPNTYFRVKGLDLTAEDEVSSNLTHTVHGNYVDLGNCTSGSGQDDCDWNFEISVNASSNNTSSIVDAKHDPLWLNVMPADIEKRMVNGDFDCDGYHDDVAALTPNFGGNGAALQVWRAYNGDKFRYDGRWWYVASGYSSTDPKGRVVSGDFDRDGCKDDIAVLYDTSPGAKLHVWLGNGGSFIYQAGAGWWGVSSGYTASNPTGRLVSGDFDRDGYHDDIAALYHSGGIATMHVWLSTGSSFVYQNGAGWWQSSPGSYTGSNPTYRLVSGDFDRDGYHDDIAALYAYSGGRTDIHVWRTSGSSFYIGTFWNSGLGSYTAHQVTGRVVSGDFDGDGYHDDIAAMYKNSSSNTDIHVWESNGLSFSVGTWWGVTSGFSSDQVSNKFISGDFDGTGGHDLVGFYDQTSAGGSLRSYVWYSSGGSFSYFGSPGWPWMAPSFY